VLTVKDVKNAKPGRHSDGNGLYLLVKPAKDKAGDPIPDKAASASWVLRVQSAALDRSERGVRRDIGLGSMVLDSVGGDIPIERRKMLTLAEAREKARIGRALAKAGINPSERWRDEAAEDEPPRTFRAVAEERFKQIKGGWKNGRHRDEWLGSLKRYAFPMIGDKPVGEVDASDIQKVLLPIWLAKPETARRVKQRIGVVLDYAHGNGWREAEAPLRSVNKLMGAIRQPKAGNFAAMPHGELPAFMAKLRSGDLSVGNRALQFTILTAARSGEVRQARWNEIDLEAAEWRIPPEKMKAGRVHIVPLVPAAVAILEEMRGLFAPKPTDVVFPGVKGKPMSDATLAKQLRTNGGGDYTVHGFRSTFRDWAADNGFNNDWAEAALAHTVAGKEGKTVAAYKRTTFLEQRRDRLMPAWAGFALGESNIVKLAAAG
jgi:integrase